MRIAFASGARTAFVIVSLVAATFAWAQSQTYPNRPVRLVSGASAGSASDLVARAVAERLQQELGGTNVLVENRTGASGLIAAQAVLQSPPDGHMVFAYTAAHTLIPLIQQVPYDPVRDFTGVATLAIVPNVLVISPAKGVKSVAELIALAKQKPGQLNYASVGAGTATYMNAEKFRVGAGIDAVHVPYKGSPEAITETMTGRIDYFFAPLVSAMPFIKQGKLLALAVGTSRRAMDVPDVPTTIEAGVPESDYVFWVGLLVPSKTPRDIVTRLNQAVGRTLAATDVQEGLRKLGAEAFPQTPEQFDALIRAELAANAKIVKAAGMKAN